MGSADIVKTALESRAIRVSLVPDGIRRISNEVIAIHHSDGSFIDTVFTGIKFIGSLLGNVLKFLFGKGAFSIHALWNAFINVSLYIWNFNWNISDEGIDQQIKSQINLLFNQLGYGVGNIVGYTLSGFLPGIAIFAFNEPLGQYLIVHQGEKVLERVAHTLHQVSTICFQSVLQTLILEGYKCVRKVVRDISSPLVQTVFGDDVANIIKGWGKPGSKPWSFATFTEGLINKIAGEKVKNFIQGFSQSFFLSFIEGGFALIHSLDAYEAHTKLKEDTSIKRGKYLEIAPDKSNPDEKMIVTGDLAQVKQQIPPLLQRFQMLDNRDVGTFAGMPLEENIKPAIQTLSLRLLLYSRPRPPFRVKGDANFATATINIPNANRAELNWDAIKEALGGGEGYEYGGHRATVLLSSGRQMCCYSISEETSKGVLTNLLQFTTDHPLRWLYGREGLKEEEPAQQKDDKPTVLMYPAYLTIISAQATKEAGKGINTKSGNYIRNKARIPLWVPSKPSNFDLIVEQMLTAE